MNEQTGSVKRQVAVLEVPAKQLLLIMQRALNTMEPDKVPGWAMTIADEVQPNYTCSFTFTREVPE